MRAIGIAGATEIVNVKETVSKKYTLTVKREIKPNEKIYTIIA